MHIAGLQKLSLLDFPDKVACTIFSAGCNFRCPYCHNASLLVDQTRYSEEDILAFLQKRKHLLDGVCVTGGEPLMWRDIDAFLAQIKALGLAVKLDTNGSYPARLRELIDAHLVDYVAMDIKNAPAHYPQTIGLPGYDIAPILESIDYLLTAPVPYEFRTTVVREFHTQDRLLDLARRICGAQRYYLQSFEDSGDVLCPGLTAYTPAEMNVFLQSILPLLPTAELRGIE